MNTRTIMSAVVACGCMTFATAADEPSEAEKGEFQLDEIVSAEFELKLDSRYMNYGVIDGKDPILKPSAYLTFFDWVYIGIEPIFDLTKGNGKRAWGEGYGNRAGKYMLIDSSVGLAHEFDLGETFGKLSVDFYYTYEYFQRHSAEMYDTQYLNLELSLGDLWFEPKLWIERDLMLDDGTYVNLEVGHTIPLIARGDESESEDDDEDPVLAFRPSVGQGFGNTQRVRGYNFTNNDNALDHGGLMDTTLKGELTWKVCSHVKLSAYVAYSDFWFDSNIRDGARERNAAWGKGCDHSWNIYGGVGVKVEF